MPETELFSLAVIHLPEILVEGDYPATVRMEQAGEDCQQSGFATARRTHEQRDLAGIKVDGDLVHGPGHRLAFPEGANQVASPEDRFVGHHSIYLNKATGSTCRSERRANKPDTRAITMVTPAAPASSH